MRLFILSIAALSLLGCEGPTGPAGPAGPAGPVGPAGEDGVDGWVMIWFQQIPIHPDYCDVVVEAPSTVTAALREGRALLSLEVLLEGYWVPTPVVWWGDNPYPEWQTVLLIAESGAIRIFNACGLTVRIKVWGEA